VQNPARSLPERRLAQLREASKIGAVYLFDWIVLAIIVGAALAFGSVAMTDYKYTLAEILFVLGIGLFVAKAILDHRNHLLRRLIAVFFVVAGGISLILLVFWVERDRRHDPRLLTESPDIRLNVEDVTLVRSADSPSSDSVIIFYLTARNVGQMASVVEGYSLGGRSSQSPSRQRRDCSRSRNRNFSISRR